MTNKSSSVIETAEKQHNRNTMSSKTSWYLRSGRIGRLRFCCYTMGCLAFCSFFLYVLLTNKTTITTIEGMLIVFVLSITAMYVFLIYPIRRLNDMNRTGYLIFIFCIPPINISFYLHLMMAPGSLGENRYGEAPEQNSPYYWIILVLSTCIVLGYAYIKLFKQLA